MRVLISILLVTSLLAEHVFGLGYYEELTGEESSRDTQDNGINPAYFPPLISTRIPDIFNTFSCNFACSGFRMCMASQRVFTFMECGTGPTGCTC